MSKAKQTPKTVTLTAQRAVTTRDALRAGILYRRAATYAQSLPVEDDVREFVEDGAVLYQFCEMTAHVTACDVFEFPAVNAGGDDLISAFRRWLDTPPDVTDAIARAFTDAMKPDGDPSHLPAHEVDADTKNG